MRLHSPAPSPPPTSSSLPPPSGLVGDAIYLIPERVRKLTMRLRHWVELRRKPPHERKVAVSGAEGGGTGWSCGEIPPREESGGEWSRVELSGAQAWDVGG